MSAISTDDPEEVVNLMIDKMENANEYEKAFMIASENIEPKYANKFLVVSSIHLVAQLRETTKKIEELNTKVLDIGERSIKSNKDWSRRFLTSSILLVMANAVLAIGYWIFLLRNW